MMSKSTLVLCSLLLVICITDQLSGVTGHSLKSAAARREKNGGKRTQNLIEEIMNGVRDEKREQQRSANHVRSTTHRALSARLQHSINPGTGRYSIAGLSTRANKLYVAYPESETVEIYDVSTFSLQHRLNVNGLKCAMDMASCPDCDVVFIADVCRPYKIHVIDDAGQLRTQWNVSSWPFGLSVNSQSNVVVTFYGLPKLREFTPSGELVREIALPLDLEYPWHAIQLDNDRYVVIDMDSLHRVCIVTGNGAVVQCYGGQSGSGVGQLDSPSDLALFGESLLVADYFNYRVLQLNASSLTYIGELINTRSEWFRPDSLAVNEDNSKLYVAYYGGDDSLINVYNLISE